MLRVPIEIDSTNALIDVLVPSGWSIVDCPAAAGWTCETTERDDGATVVNLATGDEGSGEEERFELTMTAPLEQGTYTFPVVQTYADGTESAWIGEPGGDRPAPRIQVGDDATPIERETELPTHDDAQPDAATTEDDELTGGATTTDEPTGPDDAAGGDDAVEDDADGDGGAADDGAGDPTADGTEPAVTTPSDGVASVDDTSDGTRAGTTALGIGIAAVVGAGILVALLRRRR